MKQRLFTNMFLRNMLADFGNRSANSNSPGEFTAYFQYRVGNYQPDYYLYFPKEPFRGRYINEAFNKMQEYSGYDLINYLEFHYNEYAEKNEFLRFLLYELNDRLKLKIKETYRQKLQNSFEWISEKQQELKASQQTKIRTEIENELGEILLEEKVKPSLKDIELLLQSLPKETNDRIEKILNRAEERMEDMSSSFTTGHIELNNHNHLEKVIQLLILLQTVQAPREKATAEQLFKKFSATDIASILLLHFSAFKNKKINTIQVKIGEVNERLNPNNLKTKKLVEALQDFFY